METLGRRIQRLREARHLTQQQLADLVGVDRRSVVNWESDKSRPRSRMGALQEVFGISIIEPDDIAPDAIVTAIEHSQLSRADRAELLSAYYRILDRDDRGDSSSESQRHA